MRIILDTNVLVRAAKKTNNPAREVLRLIKAGPHLLLTSEYLLRELERVMNYNRVRGQHQLPQKEIQQFINDYHTAAEVFTQAEEAAPFLSTDPDDNPILHWRRINMQMSLAQGIVTFSRRMSSFGAAT